MITRKQFDAYNRSVANLSDGAQREIESGIWAWLQTDEGRAASVAECREYAKGVMSGVIQRYDEAASSLAAQWYDKQAADAHFKLPAAVTAATYDPKTVDETARYQAKKLVNGDPRGFARYCGELGRNDVLRSLNETVIKNAGRDRKVGVRFARVTTGSENCPFCIMLAGRGAVYHTRKTAGEFRHFHRNCVVAGTGLIGPDIELALRRYFEGIVVHLVTSEGYELTVTPNHPVLTSKGWKAAGDIKQVDQLVCAGLADGHEAGVPDEQDAPPAAEDVFRAVALAFPSTWESVPATAEDFHGDGIADSEVDVVGPYGLLRNEVDASPKEEGAEDGLTSTHADEAFGSFPLNGERVGGLLSAGLFPSSCGVMGGCGLGELLASAHLRRSDDSCFRAASDFKTSGLYPAVYNLAGNSEVFGDGEDALSALIPGYNPVWARDFLASGLDAEALERSVNGGVRNSKSGSDLRGVLPGFVHCDDVLVAERRFYSGYVYNLQTVGNWFVSNGIITHNCDCKILPGFENDQMAVLVEGHDPRDELRKWSRINGAEVMATGLYAKGGKNIIAEADAIDAGIAAARAAFRKTDRGPAAWRETLGKLIEGFSNSGKVTTEDFADPKGKELQVAGWLARHGIDSKFRNPDDHNATDANTSDLLLWGETWDIKRVTSSNPNKIAAAIFKKKKQGPNFIVDLSCSKMSSETAKAKIASILEDERVQSVMLIKGGNAIMFKK